MPKALEARARSRWASISRSKPSSSMVSSRSRDVIGQVDREAIGVVQLEHHVAGNHAALQFGKVLFEDLQALLQGLGELLFLGLQHALDVCLLLFQLGKASPISATSAATILWKKVPLAPSLLPWRQARRMIRRKT